jgi:predicted NAD/FAD-binding protein
MTANSGPVGTATPLPSTVTERGLTHLGVETVESCMSFAVTADTGRFEWKGGGNNWLETAMGLFAQTRNLLSPSYLWMLRDILTFNHQSVED